jgi:methionyl aminopeptidase
LEGTKEQEVSTKSDIESVGTSFSLDKMLHTRRLTVEAVHHIAAKIEPGMTERASRKIALSTLASMGLRRGWHPALVRFGENTTKDFLDRSNLDITLGENDIFFVDIGPIFGDTEGDAGDTFVEGDNPEHHRIKRDVREIWNLARTDWFELGLTGRDLYNTAQRYSAERGWKLNFELAGHRLSDYPHHAHYSGSMGEVDIVPSSDLWVLEIHVAHPEGTFGAFFEDTLLVDQGLA